ncbi:MAG TPA: hypothetical protein VHC69_09085 [Polyangiaceae bacterium]|nr:hypothetical protein [Polyangiaceae bacterium]
MKRYVEVHLPGLGSERHELVEEEQVLGTGPDAGVRVDPRSQLRARHLELTIAATGVRVVVAAGIDGAFFFEGAERTHAFVPWGEEIFLGNVRLTFLETAEAERPSPILLGLAPVALLIGMSVFKAMACEVPSARTVEAPNLFDERVTCRERDPQVAEHRAREAERAAHAKAERFAFAFRDGVEAGRLFQESRACFETVGLESDVARVNDESRGWIGRVNDEYAAARLRLRVALDHRRYAEALEAAKELRALLGDRQSTPYAEWLAELERELVQNASTPGS